MKRANGTAKARASAKRALELDPNLADAHSVQGTVLRAIALNYAAAETEYRHALELALQNVNAIGNLANLIANLGRLDEAVALLQQAITLDPLRATVLLRNSLSVSLWPIEMP